MAIYTPDYELIAANKIIEGIEDEVLKQAVKYIIKQKDDFIKEQGKQLKSYQSVFDAISNFLPNQNPSF